MAYSVRINVDGRSWDFNPTGIRSPILQRWEAKTRQPWMRFFESFGQAARERGLFASEIAQLIWMARLANGDNIDLDDVEFNEYPTFDVVDENGNSVLDQPASDGNPTVDPRVDPTGGSPSVNAWTRSEPTGQTVTRPGNTNTWLFSHPNSTSAPGNGNY